MVIIGICSKCGGKMKLQNMFLSLEYQKSYCDDCGSQSKLTMSNNEIQFEKTNKYILNVIETI